MSNGTVENAAIGGEGEPKVEKMETDGGTDAAPLQEMSTVIAGEKEGAQVSPSASGTNNELKGDKIRIISEGKVQIPQSVNIFYNPTQEFNRDISTLALDTFLTMEGKTEVTVMEAMSASGIRAIRYAKEASGIKQVIANDYSSSAVETIRRNAERNGVEEIVQPSYSDASVKMYEMRNLATVVDVDPYGTPTPFLDSAVQCVEENGLLMVTATDMAVLAGGNHAESCFAKYGAMSLKSKACHEIALRIVAYTVQSTANRYGRVAIPLLSLSVDFYVRLMFKVIKSPKKTKESALKTSMVYQCTGCRSINFQPLASIKKGHTSFAQGPPVPRKCEHCDSSHHLGGPIWTGPIHNERFVESMLAQLESKFSYLGTCQRIKGMLGLVKEELMDTPLYYDVQELCSVVKSSSIPMIQMRSAIMNLGYQVSLSHAEPNTIKTNCPNNVLWDILRAWRLQVNPKPMQPDTIGHKIMSKESTTPKIDFTIRADAKPLSQQLNLLRYQTNPEKFWGPGNRDSFKGQGDSSGQTKRELNQGKKKKFTKRKRVVQTTDPNQSTE